MASVEYIWNQWLQEVHREWQWLAAAAASEAAAAAEEGRSLLCSHCADWPPFPHIQQLPTPTLHPLLRACLEMSSMMSRRQGRCQAGYTMHRMASRHVVATRSVTMSSTAEVGKRASRSDSCVCELLRTQQGEQLARGPGRAAVGGRLGGAAASEPPPQACSGCDCGWAQQSSTFWLYGCGTPEIRRSPAPKVEDWPNLRAKRPSSSSHTNEAK